MPQQTNIFEQVKKYWTLLALFGSVSFVLTASMIEDRIATKIPATAQANLQQSIPIDSVGIKDVGRLTIDREGHPFSALNLNGKDNFVLMDSSAGSLSNTFSLCFWVMPKDSSRQQTIFQKGENCPRPDLSDNGYSYQVAIGSNGKLSMTIFNSDGKFARYDVSESLVVDQWSFVVLSLGVDRKFECLVNMQPVVATESSEQTSRIDTIAKTASVLKIGGDENFCGGQHYFDQLFKGFVDDIMIFNRPLNAAEIAGLYEPEFKKHDKYKILLISISTLFFLITIVRFIRQRTA